MRSWNVSAIVLVALVSTACDIPAYTDSPEDCSANQLWYDSRCISPPRCTSEVPYAGITYCVTTSGNLPGTCIELNGAFRCAPLAYCTNDAICDADEFCLNNECVPKGGSDCRDDNDCDAAEICIRNHCRPRGEWCRDDTHCNEGLGCYEAHCYALCETTVDCPKGLACRCLLDDCENQAMCSSPTVSCSSNDDCEMFLLAPGEKAWCYDPTNSCVVR